MEELTQVESTNLIKELMRMILVITKMDKISLKSNPKLRITIMESPKMLQARITNKVC